MVLVPSFGCFSAAFWWNANGYFGYCLTLLKVGGAGSSVVAMCGWYLFAMQVMASVDLVVLPVGYLRYTPPVRILGWMLTYYTESHHRACFGQSYV